MFTNLLKSIGFSNRLYSIWAKKIIMMFGNLTQAAALQHVYGHVKWPNFVSWYQTRRWIIYRQDLSIVQGKEGHNIWNVNNIFSNKVNILSDNVFYVGRNMEIANTSNQWISFNSPLSLRLIGNFESVCDFTDFKLFSTLVESLISAI